MSRLGQKYEITKPAKVKRSVLFDPATLMFLDQEQLESQESFGSIVRRYVALGRFHRFNCNNQRPR